MLQPVSVVKCLLCQASLNLRSGDLDKFRTHLETSHEIVYDMDLIISVSFLESEEKERIVETVFPRIKKFFQDIKNHNQEPLKLNIEKRLLEDDDLSAGVASFHRKDAKRRKTEDPKLDTLSENVAKHRDKSPVVSKKSRKASQPPPVLEETKDNDEVEIDSDTEPKTSERLLNSNESKCDICDKIMLKKSIRKHKQRVHQIYDNFRSSFGGGGGDTSLAEEDSHDVSVDSAALEPQVDIEEQEEEQRCKICCARFDDMGELREHFKEVHEIDLDTFNDNSEENEIQIDETDTKEEKLEKVEVKGFPCDQCDATYDRKDSLRRHKRNKH